MFNLKFRILEDVSNHFKVKVYLNTKRCLCLRAENSGLLDLLFDSAELGF